MPQPPASLEVLIPPVKRFELNDKSEKGTLCDLVCGCGVFDLPATCCMTQNRRAFITLKKR